jgi:surface antigen
VNRSVGLTLRRTAGGSVIFALSFGALASPGQSVMAAVAATPATMPAAPIPDPDRHPRPVVHQSVFLSSGTSATAVAAKVTTRSAPPTVAIRTMHATARSAAAAPKPAVPSHRVVRPATSASSAAFAFGYCTWWVAHKRAVPWRGNAAQWWWNARAYGFAEGEIPQVGAIMVMAAGGSAAPEGHVGYVESVNADGSFVVSEMNWWGVPGGGWGRVDYRTIRSMRGILGFIY